MGEEFRETELWQVLDWSLWGNGLGDVLRFAMADTMVAALSVEQREQAEACIKAWHARRGPSMAVGEGTELQRQRDVLLWLHAEVVHRLEAAQFAHSAMIATRDQDRARVAELRATLEAEFEDICGQRDAACRDAGAAEEALAVERLAHAMTVTERDEARHAGDRFLRYCDWPGCLRAYDIRTGPDQSSEPLPWIQVRAAGDVILCPRHQGAGHRPQRFQWEPGWKIVRMSCECGAESGDLTPTTTARCQEWWREHVAEVVPESAAGGHGPCLPEPTGHDRGGPTWDVPEVGATVTVAVVEGQPFVSAFSPADTADGAEAYALAVLAGVRAVRQLATSGDVAESATWALATPEEWSRRLGVTVLDPDGWRCDDKPWDAPVSEQEFRERAAMSTMAGSWDGAGRDA